MIEKAEEAPSLDYMSTIEAAKTLLKEAVDFAAELVAQVNILGATEEERILTLRAFDGLTPEQLREAAHREKEFLGLHRFLDGEGEVKT